MIRIVTCVVVTCDRCQEPGHPVPDEIDGEIHFTSISDATQQLPDWRLNPGRGHATCRSCVVDEECATDGHNLEDDWRDCGCRGRLAAHRDAMTVDSIRTSTCPIVFRTLPDLSWSGLMATCAEGAAHDRQITGFDHTTALNLVAPVPDGLHLQPVAGTDTWRVVHTASGKPIHLIDWPDGVPYDCAEIAAASLATSGVDWTLPQADLADELPRVAEAARAASTAAYDAAVHAGDRTDDRPPPCDLATRLAARQHRVAVAREVS